MLYDGAVEMLGDNFGRSIEVNDRSGSRISYDRFLVGSIPTPYIGNRVSTCNILSYGTSRESRFGAAGSPRRGL